MIESTDTQTPPPSPEKEPEAQAPETAKGTEATPEALAKGPSPLPRASSRSIATPLTVRAPSAETTWAEISIAINYLTRLDLDFREEPKPRLIRKSMGWFPLIGAVIGLFGASIDWVMAEIGLPGIVTATFAVIGMLWATRALHEEEFASLANQYSHNINHDEKVGWLKEERAVRYGTLAVIFAIIMKIGAIASLGSSELVFSTLIAAGAWSRAMMTLTAAWLRPLPGDPVAEHFQQPPAFRVLLALVFGGIFAYIGLEEYAPMVMGAGAVSGIVVALLGANQLRGYNGPLLGTIQQVVELTILALILAVQSIQ